MRRSLLRALLIAGAFSVAVAGVTAVLLLGFLHLNGVDTAAAVAILSIGVFAQVGTTYVRLDRLELGEDLREDEPPSPTGRALR